MDYQKKNSTKTNISKGEISQELIDDEIEIESQNSFKTTMIKIDLNFKNKLQNIKPIPVIDQ
jgi:hypothetical protein